MIGVNKVNISQLFFLFKKGDERSFSQIYDMYSGELLRFLLKKVDDEFVAEDILHDLFLSLWKNRENLESIESLPSYLYSSCRYQVFAYYRRQIKKGDEVDFNSIDILDNEVSVEERMHYKYLKDLVDIEVENLPEKCKIVFKMSRGEYMSTKEIAYALDISESTVEKHINKAISRIRLRTKKYFHFL